MMSFFSSKSYWNLVAIFVLSCNLHVAVAQSATLRPGDKVELRLGGVPLEEINSVSSVYTVDAEGYLNLPHIGKVKAAGLQQHELQQSIENRYKSEQVYTRPTITINQQTGDRFVNVDGEVKSPQRVVYTADMTLLSAINAAGGFSEYANQAKIQVMHGGKTILLDVRNLRKDPSLDITLQPGDRIYIPRTFW